MNTQDQILRGYSVLKALKGNIPKYFEVSERWVSEFHTAIEKLEKATGLDLAEFRFDPRDLGKSVASSSSLTGEVKYREGLWCKRDLLMQKLDAVLGYFTGLQTGQNRQIGFRSPK